MSEHWYKPDGTPMHEVQTGKGAKNPTRPANLRDARKLGLLPSVTTICKMIEKPALTNWKVEQAIAAGIRLERRQGEDDTHYAQRIFMEGQSETIKAAGFGTRMHKAIEEYVKAAVAGRPLPAPDDPELRPFFDHFHAWCEENVLQFLATEFVVVGHGYAGTVDLKAIVRWPEVRQKRAIVDFKTRRPRHDEKWIPYDENAMQLGAYQRADLRKNGADAAESCLSIFINSKTPERPHVHYYEDEEITRYYQAFQSLRNAYCLLKNYQPPKS